MIDLQDFKKISQDAQMLGRQNIMHKKIGAE